MSPVPAAPRHTFNLFGSTHNVYHVNAGEGLPQHNHTFQHGTICHAGSCVVRREGQSDVVLTPNEGAGLLAAGPWHEIEALEDGTVFENIFATGVQ